MRCQFGLCLAVFCGVRMCRVDICERIQIVIRYNVCAFAFLLFCTQIYLFIIQSV